MTQYSYLDTKQILYKTEQLLEKSQNRYQITLQVANRSKRRKYENMEIIDDSRVKPVIRSIIDIVNKMVQPELLVD
uniref:DNA-directed RNA polymerase omega subunit n=1 Tax=Rhodella violacea TaxID=2801 RepID=UPI001FCDA141|nr:DNA-directed RNA polymerase omega subunit [Rhodella violacea]UNJ18104.1 DNA-directed RNA polymerase omega subunit [Rhodella violacea]